MAPPRRETKPWSPNLEPDIRDEAVPRRVEGQTLAGRALFSRYANLVRLPHTVFALPFALLGVVYASFRKPVTLGQFGLVVVAFTAARFAAMGFNRIVDRRLDALNPRTRSRALPQRALTVAQAAGAVSAACVVFVVAAGLLNPLCLALSPVALGWILAYSFTKHFTSWSHVWLGVSLAIAPAGGYLAITGAWSVVPWALPVLALGVATWVAGFDMFYALQDDGFDRAHGLKSAVVLLGRARSILVAKTFHGVTIAALIGFGLGTEFGMIYYAGVGAAAVILLWEHHLVHPDDLRRLDSAFFTMNGIMSIVVLVFAAGDRML